MLTTVEKTGRSGRLTFVTVGHTILQGGVPVVEERQDLVYRDVVAGRPVPDAGGETGTAGRLEIAPEEWSVPVSPSLLFRFSALTYNGHRIHYDRDYARTEEGYPGLVVHGPLQATVMAELARVRGVGGPGVAFEYRLVAPLFEDQGLLVGAVENDGVLRTTVRDARGRRTAEGRLEPT
jgi:3-methylfumaryl-CoA hydratase